MHYHCEIIIPPVADVSAALDAILAPFNENDDEESGRNGFWDWYVIGGRYSGRKAEAHLDPDALGAFQKWMAAESVMVSGVVFGKQELADPATVQKVDAKWREMFPGQGIIARCSSTPTTAAMS